MKDGLDSLERYLELPELRLIFYMWSGDWGFNEFLKWY
jgi:hypothetical protein